MAKPAPYPPRTPEEIAAINTLKYLIDSKFVFLDIKELDRIPNIDGYADLLDQDLLPIGKLEVQVRKLPDNCGPNPKYQMELSLFGYAVSSTLNPVLLIGVDVKEKRAYWFSVTDLVIDQKKLETQQTATVSFIPSRVIDGKDTRYMMEWRLIYQGYQTKLREFDKLKTAYATLLNEAKLTLGIPKSGIREIHEFLDGMNALLDGPFFLVKRRFYPGSWKVGLAYCDYAPDSVTYALYPIRSDVNDVQIKEVQSLRKELWSTAGIRAYFTQNPIRVRPKQHAVEVMEELVTQTIKGKLLDHKGSELLAREFIFAFVDRFADEMGMDVKDVYSLSDIENGFYRHLPIWIDEAVRFLVHEKRNRIEKPTDCLYGRPYFDPRMLRAQIMPEEMKQLGQSVIDRIARGDPSPRIPVGSEELPFGLFVEYDSFLNSGGVTEICRLYEPPDYPRVPPGGYIWEAYSRGSAEKNLKTIFDGLPAAHSAIVGQNFPQLRDHLEPFNGASKVIAVFDVEDQYTSRENVPGISFYNLKCEGERDSHISLDHISQCRDLVDSLRGGLGRSVELGGKKYKLVSMRSRILDFICDDLPMLNLVYEELERALRRYFEFEKRAHSVT